MGGAAPEGVPAETLAAAHESAAGAVSAAQSLPADAALALLDASRTAFTSGMQLVAGVSAAVLAVAAVAVMVKLRHVPPLGTAAATTDEASQKAA
jgi:DHA2 family multidrug resistance protein-like MFS transporter